MITIFHSIGRGDRLSYTSSPNPLRDHSLRRPCDIAGHIGRTPEITGRELGMLLSRSDQDAASILTHSAVQPEMSLSLLSHMNAERAEAIFLQMGFLDQTNLLRRMTMVQMKYHVELMLDYAGTRHRNPAMILNNLPGEIEEELIRYRVFTPEYPLPNKSIEEKIDLLSSCFGSRFSLEEESTDRTGKDLVPFPRFSAALIERGFGYSFLTSMFAHKCGEGDDYFFYKTLHNYGLDTIASVLAHPDLSAPKAADALVGLPTWDTYEWSDYAPPGKPVSLDIRPQILNMIPASRVMEMFKALPVLQYSGIPDRCIDTMAPEMSVADRADLFSIAGLTAALNALPLTDLPNVFSLIPPERAALVAEGLTPELAAHLIGIAPVETGSKVLGSCLPEIAMEIAGRLAP